MLTELTGQDLPHWIADASDAGCPGLPLLPQACPAHCPELTAARTLASSQPEPVNGAA
jgi:hypothetical protein